MKGLSLVAICFLILSSMLVGCGKKQDALQESQEPLSVDVMSTANAPAETTPANVTVNATANETKATAAATSAKEVTPPQGPYKPTNQEIQTALKNAGLYTGEVDGKIGPMTKKAIEAFQKAHNLPADGKIGPKTWAALSSFLNPQPAHKTKKR